MHYPYNIILFFVVVVTIVFIKEFTSSEGISFEKTKEDKKFPYRRKDYLLTVSERNFYEVLKKVSDENNKLLFAKVRLEDLLWLPGNISWRDRLSLRGRIKSRHIDFVLCDRENIRPLLAIELDDASHLRFDRVERDDFVDSALSDAGLPILHIPVRQSYDFSDLMRRIQEKF